MLSVNLQCSEVNTYVNLQCSDVNTCVHLQCSEVSTVNTAPDAACDTCFSVQRYRGTSLMRNTSPVGPYGRPMLRALQGPRGVDASYVRGILVSVDFAAL